MNPRRWLTLSICLFCLAFAGAPALADCRDDVGHSRLAAEIGAAMPDGAGIAVTQVESRVDGHWMPDVDAAEFAGKRVQDVEADAGGPGDGGRSGHATTVGKHFYGNDTGLAPGITDVAVYEANNWLMDDWLLQDGFLRWLHYGWQPKTTAGRVANHSWVQSFADPDPYTPEIFRRLDWVVDVDEHLQVAGLNNGSAAKKLLSSAYNVIAVGRTDGGHARGGSVGVDGVYGPGRTLPHLTAPLAATSYATPVVSAAAALLIQAGRDDPALSTDPLETAAVNRHGTVITNAERSEVVKAALMAGADRFTDNGDAADIVDYRAADADRSDNGLDRRYGAGQVNVYNSYHVIAAGEQNSAEDDPAGQGWIGPSGFDYDPSFGGLDGAKASASYFFVADGDHTLLSASLVWNLSVDGGGPYAFDGAAVLYDLDLHLVDETAGGTVAAASTSEGENSETIYLPLVRGHAYRLEVRPGTGQGAFCWDYALAWRLAADADGDAVPDTADAFPLRPDEWRDKDRDGLGDRFEARIVDHDPGDDLASPTDVLPEDDYDGDGLANLEEFDGGTDPTAHDLPGDINGDCVVNMADFSVLSACWGSLEPCPADLNGDGVVNMADFSILSLHWGETCQ